MKFVKSEKLWLKEHSEFDERWIQIKIAEDPSILGLGDLILKDKERMQPKAGRLDLLLQDSDSGRRYEVEVQLGKSDESHIIRTIEYWDNERKRFPQYDHCAVLVAEEITSRFLNVVGLFNGQIPIVAIQMNALMFGDTMTLIFTSVMDERQLGLEEEDDPQEITDRSYWENRATKHTVKLADDLLELVKAVDSGLELKYNKHYIGLAKNERPNNFILFKPKKTGLRLEMRLPRSDELEKKFEEAGLEMLEYNKRGGRFVLRLSKDDIQKNNQLLSTVFHSSFNNGST